MTRRKSRPTIADQRRAKEQRVGLAKILAGGLVSVGLAFAYVTVSNSQRQLDPTTLCPDDPASLTVLLIDVTDPMNLPQQQDFLNQLAKVKNSVPRYGQLTIMRVDSTGQGLLSPVITRCNPGTSADASELTGNPKKLQKQWDTGFSAPLDEVFDGIVRATGAEWSPIMESIQSVALTEFQKPGREDIPKRLIIASDLLQHTQAIDFYKPLPDPTSFVKSAPFQHVRTSLKGVDVELWQVKRPDSIRTQPGALFQLWAAALEEQGGTVVRVYNVSG